MKYLVVLALMLTMTGCESVEKHNIAIGDLLYVKEGFYKGCRGYAVVYESKSFEPDEVRLDDVECSGVTASFLNVPAKFLTHSANY